MSEINTIKNVDGKIKRLSFLFEILKQCMVICNVKHTNKQITYTCVALYLHLYTDCSSSYGFTLRYPFGIGFVVAVKKVSKFVEREMGG
jgi:hypothetical protein